MAPHSSTLAWKTPWTVACRAPLSMEFSRQEYWTGLPFPSPGDLPEPGIKPKSLMSPALAGRFLTTGATWEAQLKHLPGSSWCQVAQLELESRSVLT